MQTNIEGEEIVTKQKMGSSDQELEIVSNYKGWSTSRKGDKLVHGPFSLTIITQKNGDVGPIRVEVKGIAFNGETIAFEGETWMTMFGQEVLISKETDTVECNEKGKHGNVFGTKGMVGALFGC
ncbi:hypothetical protein A9K97_gp255 [Tokyovirus A1]|uniref:hypothetical protein n=1 Tax=Tokyovirus A1 TaxID=1826170 RepID=UPI0007A96615|nr:hypothetical protein A9K97_gp255 [Tokyovirus A1]BAU80096.1 hypothetical protein [Tokyovirus A1]